MRGRQHQRPLTTESRAICEELGPRRSPCSSPCLETNRRQAFAFPASSFEIVIFRGCTSGFLGTITCNTPFFSSALTFSPSVPSGSVNARLKLPYERSLA